MHGSGQRPCRARSGGFATGDDPDLAGHRENGCDDGVGLDGAGAGGHMEPMATHGGDGHSAAGGSAGDTGGGHSSGGGAAGGVGGGESRVAGAVSEMDPAWRLNSLARLV